MYVGCIDIHLFRYYISKHVIWPLLLSLKWVAHNLFKKHRKKSLRLTLLACGQITWHIGMSKIKLASKLRLVSPTEWSEPIYGMDGCGLLWKKELFEQIFYFV